VITNSLYQILFLLADREYRWHRITPVEQEEAVGWRDEDTCELLLITKRDLNRILGAEGYPLCSENSSPFVREEREKILTFCKGNEDLWENIRALLQSPDGRAELFTT